MHMLKELEQSGAIRIEDRRIHIVVMMSGVSGHNLMIKSAADVGKRPLFFAHCKLFKADARSRLWEFFKA